MHEDLWPGFPRPKRFEDVDVPRAYQKLVRMVAEANETLMSSDGASWRIESFKSFIPLHDIDQAKMTATFVEMIQVGSPIKAPSNVLPSPVLKLPFCPE